MPYPSIGARASWSADVCAAMNVLLRMTPVTAVIAAVVVMA